MTLLADRALDRVLQLLPPASRVLDIGCGAGHHARRFESAGHTVHTVDLCRSPMHAQTGIRPTWSGTFQNVATRIPDNYHCLWLSHVLEHQPNPGDFLRLCRYHLRIGGLLAVTVPPLKTDLVGGHVTLWTTGLLLYHLVLAGFDTSQARIRTYGYNQSVLVEKPPIQTTTDILTLPLAMDNGDLELLAPYFPEGLIHQGCKGQIKSHNWHDPADIVPLTSTAS